MKPTIKSLHSEMKGSFGEVNDWINHILLRFEGQHKDINVRFRQVDERFIRLEERMNERFDALTADINVDVTSVQKLMNNHEGRLNLLERRS